MVDDAVRSAADLDTANSEVSWHIVKSVRRHADTPIR